jgi:uncharacterized membrane protein YeaQ/YmgE (transglycosylase-associated protein family)
VAELEFSEAAQHCVNVVLIWIGFGTLAGLLAKAVLPGRDPGGAMATLLIGIAGSALGLAFLSWLRPQVWGDGQLNPVSPLGFFAATAGAFILLIGYRLLAACAVAQRKGDRKQ